MIGRVILIVVLVALGPALAPAVGAQESQGVSIRVTAVDTPRPTKTPKPSDTPRPTKSPKPTNGGGGLGTNVLGNVAGNGGGGGPLPRTGRDIALLAMIGASLVGTGTGLIVAARRRRRSS